MSTVLETNKVAGLKPLYYLSVLTAVFSGVFCVCFAAILIYQCAAAEPVILEDSTDPSYRQPATDSFNLLPTDQPEVQRLKKQLASDKQTEALKEQVRQLDLQLRYEFFRKRELVTQLSPFLLFAAAVFILSTRTVSVLKRKIPRPVGEQKIAAKKSESERLKLGTLSLAAFSALLVGLAGGLMLLPASSFEKILAEKYIDNPPENIAINNATNSATAVSAEAKTPTETPTAPKDEPPLDREQFLAESQKHWISLFSPLDKDNKAIADLPTHWDVTKDENIVWKTPVPLAGKSSPVIWGDKVFLTGADAKQRQVFCFNAQDGKLLWKADCPASEESQKTFKVSEDTGFAAPTMVLDGKRAFALFANGDLAAFDFDGKLLWDKHLGIPESSYGFAASPALFFDKLIVQYDFGDGTAGKSKLAAFDTATGNIAWETQRDIPNSWSSPIVRKVGSTWQIITCGDPNVIAYNPEDGKEIWKTKCLSGDVGPTPAVFGDVVFVSNQSPRSSALNAATGEILWTGNNALPDTPTPFANAERFFTLDSSGYLTAYNPKSIKGNKAAYWELEIGKGESTFYSSPLLVGSFVYLFSKNEEEPKAFVVDLTKAKTDESGALTEEAAAAMQIAENPMGEPCVASPAVIGNRLFIRGTKTLFCVGVKTRTVGAGG
jgi:outer membrane protein assembly factor BamB